MYIITKKFLCDNALNMDCEMSHTCEGVQNSFYNGKTWLKPIAFYLFSVIIINSVTGL